MRGHRISKRFGSLVIAAGLVLAPAIARAELLPDPERIAGIDEAAASATLREILALGPEEPALALPRLDALLARLERPTPFRGYVQFLRAAALGALDREDDARPAAEEAIRLLPTYSAPLLMAGQIEAYSDRPTQAVEYLVRASRIDPEMVRKLPDYEVNNLILRLSTARASRHAALLAARLFDIGWIGESLPLRSGLAARLVKDRLGNGDVAGAKAMIPNLVDPADVYALLIDKRYEPLWPTLEQWAGPRQEQLWRVFLPELKARWATSRDPSRGKPYVDALQAAGRDAEIADEFLPVFSRRLDPESDYDLLWIASPLADALARLGRWDEIETMFGRGLDAWPVGSDVNALNLSANRGRLRYLRGDAANALSDLEAAIAEAEKKEALVSRAALRGMHFYRACALHALGRDADAFRSSAIVRADGTPTLIAELHLCFGRDEQAREALISGLAREADRADVLQFAQASNSGPVLSDVGKSLWQRRDRLRKDPKLLAAIAAYGRVLPYPRGAGAAAPTAPQSASPAVRLR